MTVEYREEERKRTEQVAVSRMCDGCGAGMDLCPGSYRSRSFTLEFTFGYTFPESGDKQGWCVPDLCNECVAKLRVLLEAQGIAIKEIEEYW
jgi:hypothetical protein